MALVLVIAIHLVVASLIALNSALDAERPALAAADLAVIALVSAAWPIVACVLMSALAWRKLFDSARLPLPAVR